MEVTPGEVSEVLTGVGRSAKTNNHQLCADTGCLLEDMPRVMDDRDGWGERVKEREREREIQFVQSVRLEDDDDDDDDD